MQRNPPSSSQTQSPGSKIPFTLQNIDNFRCDNPIQYPYYPLITTGEFYGETYLATKSRDTVVVFHIHKDKTIQTHPFDPEILPSKSAISSLQFISAEAAEKARPLTVQQKNSLKSSSPLLYILIGFYSGYLILVQFNRKGSKVLLKFNKTQTPPESLFSKTFSFIYSANSNANDYSVWQKSTVVKIASNKNALAYLFRNGIFVLMNTLSANLEQLQKGFEGVLSLAEDDSKKKANNTAGKSLYVNQSQLYQTGKGKSWKMIRGHEGAIFGFDQTVSCFHIDDNRLIMGTFQGELYFFDRSSLKCLITVQTSVAIKNVTCHNKFLLVCLQDDCVQVIDLGTNRYLNIVGHKSFTNSCYMYKGMALVSSFDGSLSVTDLPQVGKWNGLRINKEQDKVYTWWSNREDAPVQVMTKERFQIGKGQSGIGSFLLSGDLMVFGMLDNFVRLYKLCPGGGVS